MSNEQSSIQDEVTQLKSVITKTIENNNENVLEVERELEILENERRAATEKVILTEAFNADNDFVPIVETFSEDDAIVIKPNAKSIEAPEHGYALEDPANKHGKLAAIDVTGDSDKMPATVSIVSTTKPTRKQKFDDNDDDDVTIGSDGLKVRGFHQTHTHTQISKKRTQHSHKRTHTHLSLL